MSILRCGSMSEEAGSRYGYERQTLGKEPRRSREHREIGSRVCRASDASAGLRAPPCEASSLMVPSPASCFLGHRSLAKVVFSESVEKAGFPPVGWVQPTDAKLVGLLGCAEPSSVSPTLQKTVLDMLLVITGFSVVQAALLRGRSNCAAVDPSIVEIRQVRKECLHFLPDLQIFLPVSLHLLNACHSRGPGLPRPDFALQCAAKKERGKGPASFAYKGRSGGP